MSHSKYSDLNNPSPIAEQPPAASGKPVKVDGVKLAGSYEEDIGGVAPRTLPITPGVWSPMPDSHRKDLQSIPDTVVPAGLRRPKAPGSMG